VTAPPPQADGGEARRSADEAAETLARVLEISDEEWQEGWWSFDGDEFDAVIELLGLMDTDPAVAAAALLQEARAGRAARIEALLHELSPGESLVRAAATLDITTARRWAPRLLDLEGCIEALGARAAIDVVADELRTSYGVGAEDSDGTGHDSGDWVTQARQDLWQMTPARMWAVLYHADRPTGLPEPDNLLSWALEVAGWGGYAPWELFHPDPRPEGLTSADLDLLDAHVEAFIGQISAAVAAGDSFYAVLDWAKSVGDQVHGCGDPDCCRPSLFYSSLMQRGWFVELLRRRPPTS
jgi:hypothetical protein